MTLSSICIAKAATGRALPTGAEGSELHEYTRFRGYQPVGSAA